MPVEGVRSLGTWVTSGSELPSMYQELNSGSLQVQQTLLISEPSLQPLCLISGYILLILNIEVFVFFSFFFIIFPYESTNFNIYYMAESKDTMMGQKILVFSPLSIFLWFPREVVFKWYVFWRSNVISFYFLTLFLWHHV